MGIYTASIWTKITSSANVPPFDTNVYSLKATLDDTSHTLPGNPYLYPTNLTQGQNLYVVFTAPSGANVTEILCLSSSYRMAGGSGQFSIRYSLRSGSCAASGSHINNLGSDIQVYYTVVDDNNNYYYEGPITISMGNSYGQAPITLSGDYDIASITVDAYSQPNPDFYIIGDCGACGQPNLISFDNPYAVVQPNSITSSAFPAQIVVVSGSNYAIKVSSSADGIIANCDMEIGWNPGTNTPIYYGGSFGAVYYSTAISASVQKNDCSSGYEGSYVTYTLPASSSQSTASYAIAQAAAQATFNANSQSYANTYGSCIATGSTINVYAKAYMGNGAQLNWFNLTNSTSGTVDFIDTVGCNNWGIIEANNGDYIMFETDGYQAISGNDTGPCPATAAGCSYYYLAVSGNQSVYITVDSSISC